MFEWRRSAQQKAEWQVWSGTVRLENAPKRGTVFRHELLVALAGRDPRSCAEWTRFVRATLQRSLEHLVGPDAPLQALLEDALGAAARSWPPKVRDEPVSIWAQRIAVEVALLHLARTRDEAAVTPRRQRSGGVREVLTNVYVRLRKWPPEEQIAFALLELDGRSASEAALVLRLPSPVVQQRAARARRRIMFAARRDRLLARYLQIAGRLRALARRCDPRPVPAFA